jgi:hypothetical protein
MKPDMNTAKNRHISNYSLRTPIAFILLAATLAVGWAQTPVPDSFNPSTLSVLK